MQFKLSELKAQRARELNRKVTWVEIEEATGIGRNTLIAMDKGDVRQIRPEYIDALAAYFGVEEISDLLHIDPVALPLLSPRGAAAV
jgi:DNA-binding Xre family transcriptional regulator